jgi:S1-C subfamily serine protease
MKAQTIFLAALAVLLAVPATAGADPVEEAIKNLLATKTDSLVLVEFDLKNADGTGGREVKLQGTVVGADGLVLVSGAKQVDPPVGSGSVKPTSIKVHFPGDVKKDAVFVGKDEELNLALIRINPESGEAATYAPAAFAPDVKMTPGQLLILLKRLPKSDDDLVTFNVTRVSTVIPKPGLPSEYRVLGSFAGFDGCPAYAADGTLVGFVTGGERGGRMGRGFRIVGGRVERIGGRGGARTRLLDAATLVEFLNDPTKFARRDCWLGVSGLQALTKELAEACGIESAGGLIVGEVKKGSPAETAGIAAGDVLVALDGKPIDAEKDRDIESFQKTVRRAKAGEAHELKLLRPGDEGYREVALKVAFEESPLTENEVAEYHDKSFGLKLKPLTRDFLERSRLPLDTKGVRVTWVESAGWASIAGVRSGDVIQKMVLKPCPDMDAYEKIMAALMKSRDAEVCYNVLRQRKSLFVCVRPDWENVEGVGK